MFYDIESCSSTSACFFRMRGGFPLIISAPILASAEDREAVYVEVTKEFWDRQSHTALKLKKKGKETLRKHRRNVSQVTGKLSE